MFDRYADEDIIDYIHYIRQRHFEKVMGRITSPMTLLHELS